MEGSKSFQETGDNLMAYLSARLLQQQQEELARRNRIQDAITNPQLFGEWLKKFEPASEVGKRGRGNEEPLIKFLFEYTGLSCNILESKVLYVYSVTDTVSLPDWVIVYLNKITDTGRKYGDPVTAKDCLEALEM
jgi:hypothetical protein